MLRELPDCERPREKLLSCGVASLSSAELLAVLISSGTRDESAISLAVRVLSMEHGSLAGLAAYLPEEFMAVKGIGTAKACVLTAAMELGRRIATAPPVERLCLDEPSKVAALFMEELRPMRRESFRVAMLNVRNELIARECVSIGGISSSSASAREVFSSAVKKGAAAVILVHNHPSGDPSPSDADVRATSLLADAGKILGIEVLDHIIIGDGRFFSMKASGVLK